MPTLFIRLQSRVFRDEDGVDLSCDWLILEDDDSVRASGVTDYRGLSELIDPSADWLQIPQNLVIVVPAEHVLGITTEVPGRSVGQIRRALPFVVEEFVAADIEEMHLAHGPIRRGNPIRVNLMDTQLLTDWLEALAALELRPGYLLSDAELLPAAVDTATVLLEPDTALIRTDAQAASVDLDNLALVLGGLDVSRVDVVNGNLTDRVVAELDPELEITGRQIDDPPLVYLGRRWRTSSEAVNLLQGDFTAARPPSENLFRWRSVAGLAAIWLLIGFLGMVGQGLWSSTRADSLEAESEALFRDIFPGARRINDVRRQMSQRLGQKVAGSSMGFATYLGHLAQGIDRSVSVWSITYTESRDELAADLQLRSYDDLEQLKQRMNQLGVRVEITSAEQQDSGVRARVRLKGQGSPS